MITTLSAIVLLGALQAVAQNTPAIKRDVQRMDGVVRFYADDPPRTFMGVVLVARGADVLFAKGYGMANLEWSIPHTPATKIAIGSNSKQGSARSRTAERSRYPRNSRTSP